MTPTIHQLLDTLPQRGRVAWIGIRPARGAPMIAVDKVRASTAFGLEGDRYQGRSGQRQVTLIQAEHLAAVGAYLDRDQPVDAADLRRNLVVSGINLLALKDRQFAVGGVVLQMTGSCHPCSRMEQTLGPGGYNALRGHGGITARVLQGGEIALGDPVYALFPDDTDDGRDGAAVPDT